MALSSTKLRFPSAARPLLKFVGMDWRQFAWAPLEGSARNGRKTASCHTAHGVTSLQCPLVMCAVVEGEGSREGGGRGASSSVCRCFCLLPCLSSLLASSRPFFVVEDHAFDPQGFHDVSCGLFLRFPNADSTGQVK